MSSNTRGNNELVSVDTIQRKEKGGETRGLTEGQLLQGPVRGLWEEEPDETDLEGQPAAVGDQPLPADIVQTDRVDKGGEEAGHAAEQLEDGDAARALGVGPQLDEVGVGERVVAEVVAGRVGKDEEDGRGAGGGVCAAGVFGRDALLHRHRPADVDDEQRARAHQVHGPPAEARHQHGRREPAHQRPARDGQVDLLLEDRVRVSDHREQVAQVVRDQRVAGPLREEAEER